MSFYPEPLFIYFYNTYYNQHFFMPFNFLNIFLVFLEFYVCFIKFTYTATRTRSTTFSTHTIMSFFFKRTFFDP